MTWTSRRNWLRPINGHWRTRVKLSAMVRVRSVEASLTMRISKLTPFCTTRERRQRSRLASSLRAGMMMETCRDGIRNRRVHNKLLPVYYKGRELPRTNCDLSDGGGADACAGLMPQLGAGKDRHHGSGFYGERRPEDGATEPAERQAGAAELLGDVVPAMRGGGAVTGGIAAADGRQSGGAGGEHGRGRGSLQDFHGEADARAC